MWGINPVTVGKIIGGVAIGSLLFGKHGATKVISDKIIIHTAQKEIDLAKSIARSIAQQDRKLYEEIKQELREKLTEDQFQQIFNS